MVKRFSILLVGIFVCPAAFSEESKSSPDELVLELSTTKVNTARTQLINGVSNFHVQDWKTVVVASFIKANLETLPDGRCTGTFVGPGVLLLAAHCLDLRRGATLRPTSVMVDNSKVPLTCAIVPAYYEEPPRSVPMPRRSEDFALCYSKAAANSFALRNMRFERVDTRPLSTASKVLMMGYGCTDIKKLEDRDVTLRIGDAAISAAPDGLGRDGAYSEIYSSRSQPALCPGDSGGPLFTGVTVELPLGPRRVRGVNSAVIPEEDGYTSKVAMLSDPSFRQWATKWVAKFSGAYICGLDGAPDGAPCAR